VYVCVCVDARMTHENSAHSEMSKLLSFGYLDTSSQSPADNRKSSAGTRYQPSLAGPQATRHNDLMTGYQANTSPQSLAGAQPTRQMSGYQADRQPTGGTLLSSQTSTGLPPASSSAA